jgi:hypothetical protein
LAFLEFKGSCATVTLVERSSEAKVLRGNTFQLAAVQLAIKRYKLSPRIKVK